MPHRSTHLPADEVLNTDDADRILADLAELMFGISSPTLRRILLETAEEIKELLNEACDEQTELEVDEKVKRREAA